MSMPQHIIYTKELLQSIVPTVTSWGALIEHFGKKRTGGNYNAFQRRILKYSMDTSHFKGKGWSKGLTADHPGVGASRNRNATVLAQLKVGSLKDRIHGARLRTFLLDSGVKYACAAETCGIFEWQGKTLSLDVDHVNGDNTDQRLENLRFLCPNCHRQTSTWGSKNRK